MSPGRRDKDSPLRVHLWNWKNVPRWRRDRQAASSTDGVARMPIVIHTESNLEMKVRAALGDSASSNFTDRVARLDAVANGDAHLAHVTVQRVNGLSVVIARELNHDELAVKPPVSGERSRPQAVLWSSPQTGWVSPPATTTVPSATEYKGVPTGFTNSSP